jgi:ribosomal-protein-alanine N-acetyltransferase
MNDAIGLGSKRTSIDVMVRETNVAAQVFFRKHGFRAVSILRGHYELSDEDGYLMRYGRQD